MMLSLASLTLALGFVSANAFSSPAAGIRHRQHARVVAKRTDDNNAPVVVPTDLVDGWEVVSTCAKDNTRVMVQPDVFSLDDNTPSRCVAYCDNNGYTYAGVEWSRECWCSRAIYPELLEDVPESECNMPCTGDNTQACGAGGRIQLFGSTSTAQWDDAPLAPGWSVATQCAIDSRALRTLCNLHVYSLDEENTPEACTAHCAANGYKFAGVEYGKECHCGTGFSIGLLEDVLEAPIQECYQGCMGDETLACGAPDRIQLYVLNNAVSPALCIERGTTINLPTLSSTSSSSSTTSSSTVPRTTTSSSSSTTARSTSSSSSSSTTARSTSSSSSSSTTSRVTTSTTRSSSTRPTYRPTRTWHPKPCHKTKTPTPAPSTTARTTTSSSSTTSVRSTSTATPTPTKPCNTPTPKTVAPGGQCGGLLYWGPTTCTTGYKCVKSNFLFSFCKK